MTISRDYVLRALLCANYFPSQRSNPTELPGIFGTDSFTPSVATQLASQSERKIPGYMGYDAVEFESTRFDGNSRQLSIPHPMAHARLSLCIYTHWSKISYIAYNRNSRFRPKRHLDGRLFIMSYGDWTARTRSKLAQALLHSYVVEADVAQCYPSIYSHAIAWATVGLEVAKRSAGKKFSNEWFNELDSSVMMQKRNETSGVLIGPGTSNIVVELILARVDEELRKAGFTFERYVDDYFAYVRDLEQASSFRRSLRMELMRYKLSLNEKKSGVKELPGALQSKGIVEVSSRLPQGRPVSRYEAISYLDFAVAVAREHPGVNPVKYALKTILQIGVDESAVADVLLYSLMLAYYQPGLLPLLELLPRQNLRLGIGAHRVALNNMIQDFAKSGKPDGVIWAMYLLSDSGEKLDDDSAIAVLNSRDCLSLVLLYHFGTRAQQSDVITLAKTIAKEDPYTLDQYWLLLYEIFREQHTGNPYHRFGKDRHVFVTMRDMDVRFVNVNIVST